MKRLLPIITLLFALFVSEIKAQNARLYTQYMFMPTLYNPAYTGFNDMAMATMTVRRQWAGIQGAPFWVNFNAHSSLPIDKMGAGVSIYSEGYGVSRDTEITLSYGYRLNIGENKLSFGLQGMLVNHRVDYSSDKLIHQQYNNGTVVNDDLFQGTDSYADSHANFGLGVMYGTPKYFIGAAIPRLLKDKIEDGTPTGLEYGQYFTLNAGMIKDLSNEFKLRPSILLKKTAGFPLNIDFTGELLFNEMIWFGASLRTNIYEEALKNAALFSDFGLIFQYQANDYLKAGFVYEIPMNGSKLRATKLGMPTFELFANINFKLFDEHAIQTVYY